MPIPIPYSTCLRRQCVVCATHDALVSSGASPLQDNHLQDEECSATVEFFKRTACASILSLDEWRAAYRWSGDSPDAENMCDFGALRRDRGGNSVLAVELKSRTISVTTIYQLQAGLDLLHREFARASATATARALLVARRPVAQLKRIFQTKRGLLQENRSLSYGQLRIGLEFVESGSVINC